MPSPKVVPPPRQATLRWLRLGLLALFALAAVALVLIPEDFRHFSERAIGIGILEAVDASYRNNVYMLCVVAGLGLSTALFLGVELEKRTGEPHVYRVEALLALCAAGNALMALSGEFSGLFVRTALLSLFYCFLLLGISRFCRDLPERHKVFLLAASWQSFMLSGIASGQVPGLYVLGAVTLLTMGLLLFVMPPEKGPAKVWTRAAGPLLALVLFAPIAFLLANEASYIARVNGLAWPPLGFFVLQLILVCVFVVRREDPWPQIPYAALCVVVTTVAFNEYTDEITYRVYDLFHHGEAIVPLQQWDSFGRLPFLDYMPVHGLFDLFPHGLYFWLTGSNVLEAPVWGSGYFFGWVLRACSVVLVYFLFRMLLGPVAAFLLLWLLPAYHLVEPYYVLLLLPALNLLYVQEDRASSVSWWLRQWLITLGLALWRPDFGIAATAANIVLAGLMAWQVAHWRPFFRALAAAMFVLVPVLVAYLWSGPAEGVEHLALLYSYLKNQVAVVSYTRIYEVFDYSAFMQYVLLPAASVILASFCASRLLLRAGTWRDRRLELLIVFLGAVTLVIAMRSLHRHSLLEGMFKPYFFLLLPVLFALRYAPPRWALPSVAAMIVVTYMILPISSNSWMRAGHRYDPPWEYPGLEAGVKMPQWDKQTTRLTDKVHKYDAFLHTMGEALEPGQTFFDFSNGPLLYALADVPLPVFFMETVYLSTDTIQARTVTELESWRAQGLLPFIVMRQNLPLTDSLDGVDNALRSYRVAEYLYRYYQPCFEVSGLDIWAERPRTRASGACRPGQLGRGLPPGNPARPLRAEMFTQELAFGHLPFYWARLDEVVDPQAPPVGFAGLSSAASERHLLTAGQQKNPCHDRACYLDLYIESEVLQRVGLYDQERIAASFVIRPGHHHYRLRISTLWHFFRMQNWPALSLQAEKSSFVIHQAALVPLRWAG